MISKSYDKFTKTLMAVTMATILTFGFTSHAAGLSNGYYQGEQTRQSGRAMTFAKNVTEVSEKEKKEAQEAAQKAAQLWILQEAARIEAERVEAERLALEAERVARQEASAAQIAWSQVEPMQATYSEQDLLAALIHCEARNQPYEGQVAVAAVVMNRVRHSSWPNTITEVVYQSGQFGPAMTGLLDSVLASGEYSDTARQAAADALAGSNPIGDCIYFGCGDYGVKIGDHWFH